MSLRHAALLAAALALSDCHDASTPVEPTSTEPAPLPALGLSILPAAAGDRPLTLTLEGHFCPCWSGPVSVSINGTPFGSLACGETKVFPVPVIPVRLQLTSPGTKPLDAAVGSLDVGGPTPELAGLRVGVWCATTPG